MAADRTAVFSVFLVMIVVVVVAAVRRRDLTGAGLGDAGLGHRRLVGPVLSRSWGLHASLLRSGAARIELWPARPAAERFRSGTKGLRCWTAEVRSAGVVCWSEWLW